MELGAGTGAITKSLMAIRSQLSDLIVIEKSARLVDLLIKRYPSLNITADCASGLDKLRFPTEEPLTIVSSLPLRSLPYSELNAIRDAIGVLSTRHPGFRFIQYSYFGKVPFVSPGPWLSWAKKQVVFTNIPPATIWVLEQRDEGNVSHE
ncbi:MAG: ribosomal adenine dimethylase family protein [Rhodocyclales bacterium]|nr:ribosomal adenine dimethylase family protein [Rhodocyclales bacterium]